MDLGEIEGGGGGGGGRQLFIVRELGKSDDFFMGSVQ